MEGKRRQLTLFIDEPNGNIEKIRAAFNPVQFGLISAHVTLCREDEIEPMEETIARIESVSIDKPIRIRFTRVERFANGKGVFMPSVGKNHEFKELRKAILGQTDLIKEQIPHVTLMHPRNSTCVDEVFEKIKQFELPTQLAFTKVSLIEQINGGKWNILKEFDIVNS